MVKHNLEQISRADGIDIANVIMTDRGRFIVPSESMGLEERYDVFFGDETSLPSCTCFAWYNTPYLCKHFFAIFKKFPAWSWNALSPIYKDSPYMKLDNLFEKSGCTLEDQNEATYSDEMKADQNEMHAVDEQETGGAVDDLAKGFGKELKTSRNNGSACRELLDEIRRTTFLLEDNQSLMEELREHLTTLQAELFNSVPRECGIPLRRAKTRKATTKVKSEQFLSLPCRKRKVKFGGRVGQRKEKIMRAMEINVSEEGNHGDIETEIITTERDKESDSSSEEKSLPSGDEGCQHSQSQSIENKQNLAIKELEKHIVKDEVLSREMRKGHQERLKNSISMKTVHESIRTHINGGDLRNIGHKKCLTGNVIAVLQKIIKDQYPGNIGLQDPLCGIRLKFKIYKEKPFVQILHDGSYHWVTVSTFHCKPGEVIYMDSLFNGKIKQNLLRQICSLVRHEKNTLTIKVIPVQQQKGSVDCGLFAIAFAHYILVHKEYPSSVNFNQMVMRHHILRALAANQLDLFPTTNEKAKQNADKIIKVDLYCTCRLPWFPSDGTKVERY